MISAPQQKTTTASLLVIDDDAHVCRAMQRILEVEGYSVQVAGDGAEGLKRIQAGGIDLVLTDLDMPNKNGFELIHELKQIRSNVPVILFSGAIPLKVQEKLSIHENLDVEIHLHKPISREHLLKAIRYHLEHGIPKGRLER